MIKKYKPLYKTKKQIPRRYTEDLLPSEKKQMEKEILTRPKSLKFWTGDKLYKKRIDKEKVKIPKSQYYLKYVKKYGKENTGSLFKISKVTKIPLKILKQVYKRGIGAWTSGHRPGVMPAQWAMARVYSFVMKGKTTRLADKDLFNMIKQKRNPSKDDKKLMRKVAELLAKAIEKEPDGIKSYLLAAELVRRDSLYCEECHNYDIEEGCDWDICYPEMDELLDESDLDMAKEAAEELAEDLGIVDYVKVFRFEIEYERYVASGRDAKYRHFISLKNINLSKTDLSEIDLSSMNLSETDLSGSNLSRAILRFADLKFANLSHADLFEADLSHADLFEADLTEANLVRTDLYDTNLYKVNLTGANLDKTDFTSAKLCKTTFNNVKNKNSAVNLIIPNPDEKALYEKTKNKTKKKSRTIRTNI